MEQLTVSTAALFQFVLFCSLGLFVTCTLVYLKGGLQLCRVCHSRLTYLKLKDVTVDNRDRRTTRCDEVLHCVWCKEDSIIKEEPNILVDQP